MFERIKQMIIKEFIHSFRDRRMFTVLLIIPVMQTFLFGYALTTDVKHIKTAVYDMDNTISSRGLTTNFLHSGYFDLYKYIHSYQEAQKLLDSGKVELILHMEKGFEHDILSGNEAEVQLLISGVEANTASIIKDYSTRIINNYSDQVFHTHISRLKGKEMTYPSIQLQSRAWFNENLESRNFFIPGIITNLLLVTTLALTSIAIVREKEMGTIEQMIVTPITSAEFILGKTIPFTLIAIFDVIAICLVAYFWFHVPFRGSLLTFSFGITLYLVTNMAIGLYVSTISKTQQQALMTAFLLFFPMSLLSGFIFPIENMPKYIQWLAYLNPVKYMLTIIRGIFLKGIGIENLWPQMVCMAMIGISNLALAINRFKKTMV